ncbi:hypothetical protein [Paractinoplanes durhamensis]|nr:hypothetical protein [Actinoplanes durhamensis]
MLKTVVSAVPSTERMVGGLGTLDTSTVSAGRRATGRLNLLSGG